MFLAALNNIKGLHALLSKKSLPLPLNLFCCHAGEQAVKIRLFTTEFSPDTFLFEYAHVI